MRGKITGLTCRQMHPSGLPGRRMPGLINSKLRAVRQADRGQKPPALIRDITCHFDSLAPQLGQGGLNVVTHEVELVMACTVSWVNGKLGRGQSENEPASARVSRRHAQYVCKERAHLRGIWGKHDGMYARDHTAILTVDPAVAVICPHSGAGELLEWRCRPLFQRPSIWTATGCSPRSGPCRDEVSESRHRRCRPGD
jgi:hypothetical protein